MPAQCLDALRGQIGGIILGSIFLFIGLAACAIAAFRGFKGVRLLLWQGIFSALYGARFVLRQIPAVFSILPHSIWHIRADLIDSVTYVIVIPALLFWLDLSRGVLRRILQVTLIAALLLAAAGVGAILFTQSPERFMPWNNLFAVWTLFLLAGANAIPPVAKKFLIIQSPIATAGVLISAAAAVYTNLEPFLRLPFYPALEPLAFAAFFLSLGVVVIQKVLIDQRRLLSIEGELAIARDIQNSILPISSPGLEGLRIAAAYRPMTAVAGDFYEFVPVDPHRIGFLVADVSGHGVPAALIAAMIKVAMQSVVPCAHDPRAVLSGLNRSLSPQLRSQFVSAGYLFLDTLHGKAFYSAAGHPPLLRWRDGRLDRIESNGILFGVLPDPDYPVLEISIQSGDRFLLYTDGVTEPENVQGEAFGDRKLEYILRTHRALPPQELLDKLLAEVRIWQPSALPQQDDITLIVMDVA